MSSGSQLSKKQRASARFAKKIEKDAVEAAVTQAVRQSQRKKVKAVAGEKVQKSTNPLLRTYLLAEEFGGVRYPDSFPRKTATCQALENYEMFYFQTPVAPATDPGFEVGGTFLNCISPVMLDPILEYREVVIPSTVEHGAFLGTPSEQFGFVPLTDDQSSLASASDQLVLPIPGTVNVRAPIGFTDQDFIQPIHRGFDIAGNVFYGTPFRYQNTAAGGLEVNIMIANGPAAATPSTAIFAQAVTRFGVVEQAFTTTIATLGSITTGQATFTNAQLNTICPTGTNSSAIGLPGIGIRIRTTSTAGLAMRTIVLNCGWRFIRGAATSQARYESLKLPDEALYTETVDQYRVVSLNSWMMYQGAELTNGGQTAGIMYRGGRSFGENGLWDYSLVANTPGGFQGAVKNGLFSIWLPSNEEDMLWRNLDETDRWKLTYIVNSGIMASPAILNALRLRVSVNFEFTSTTQAYQYKFAEIDPMMIAHAATVLRDVCPTMENPLHLKAIGEWLRKAAHTVVNIGKWGVEHWTQIAPLAAGAAALMA